MEQHKRGKLIVPYTSHDAREIICDYLARLLQKQDGYPFRPLIFLCIGSDRYTGDALGPLVGSYLREAGIANVYGTLDSPVHAGNLTETAAAIKRQYPQGIVVAVDACLGKPQEIGNVEVWEGGVQAGIAVGNRLPLVGNIALIAVVNAGGQIGYLDLQSTPLAIVVKLSRLIGGAVVTLLDQLRLVRTGTAE